MAANQRSAALAVLAALALLASAVLGHYLMSHAPQSPWTVVALLGPMALITTVWLWRSAHRVAAVATVVALTLLALALGRGSIQAETLYVAQHAGIHLALAAWFWSTMRSTPLIVQVAQRVHALTPDMKAYASRVTQAWVLYFVGMAAVSVALFAWAPFAWWSLFANVLTPLGVVAMFVGEYVLRYRLHPEFERVTMRVAIDAWRRGPGQP